MSGSLLATASNASLLTGTGSVGFTTTGSFTTMSGSVSTRVSQIESVYATTGSNSFRATQSITGSLTVTGQIIAQTLNVQQVTSSIVYSSGSNVFGCDINSRQTFTGSFYQTGSVAIFSNTICGCILTGPTISAGSPTNSRIVSNASTMYGYYDVEVNPRWTLGRDVWAGGAVGLAFGVGGTTTCYAMIGDPSGYGCTIGFSILVPNGCSGTTYEKMRLTTTGLLIGSGSIPSDHILQVHSPCAYARMALTNPTTGVTSGDGLIFQMEGTTGIIKNQEADSLKLGANGSETQLILTSGGNVGIATDAPSTKFEVCSGYIKNTGATNASGYLYYNTSANYTLSLSGNASYAQLYSTDNIALMFGNNNLSRMFIQTNGFVGVATTSPKAVFDVACGNAHGTISTWCKNASNGTMYNGFDILMDEASFAGQLYIQGNGAGLGIQATYDVLASYDRLCIIPRSCMNRGQGECFTIPSYTVGGGSKRICIQQNNTSGTSMVISAMLIGTAYGGSYICAQA